jgi:ribosome-associated toxin RatA of RatAB toxin-antitoxin module
MPHRHRSARRLIGLLVWSVVLPLSPAPALAADADAPHPHRGRIPAVGVPPTGLSLTTTEREALARGEAIRKTLRGKSGGRGVAIVDVAAPPEVVWACLRDFSRYPQMVPNVKAAEVYSRAGDHVWTRFVLGGGGVSIEYFVDHVFRPQDGYMTWTLDYDRKSDLDDSVGFWRVYPHPEKPGHARIFYSIDIRVGWWVPGFVEDMLAKDGLTRSTEWVKVEAERRRGAAG